MSGDLYQPCAVGLHVCGITADEENFVTVANLPTPTQRAARTLFERAKADLAAGHGEPWDLVVDLCEGPHDISEDFPMTRQMLARLKAMHAEAA